MVQYRQQLMPLVQIEGVNIQSSGSQPILVFADDGRSMGLVVDEIIDIVEERLNIEVAGPHAGILGSAVIKGQATDVPCHLLNVWHLPAPREQFGAPSPFVGCAALPLGPSKLE
jgi:hypothetical protein